ncbi:D-glycero-alpha-D-manno-heptose-1,7-bisphosphate 7-phosphatase [Tumebacillus flagellatus]|uniref:D-glycero-alpha-D-manno-heptose-1,7-bisphosphate 7-phosphatase n=1 Tax=Tumebacillus flagellatus TaxID=1157490 RepID=UPI00068BD104|nr:HAD family hydrolase [Tumebacillus flagellatus]
MFLDRDGTVIPDLHYLKDPCRVELLPGAAEGLQVMQDLGFELFLVTNQSGVARGYLTAEDVQAVNDAVGQRLAEQGIFLRDVRVCPHWEEGCACRKPEPGMLLDLAAAHGLELSQSVMVGDKWSDVEAGKAAGAAVSVRLAPDDVEGGQENGVLVLPDLLAVALWLQERFPSLVL